ncbi:phage holin family protein [Serratia fonticola]
MITHEITHDPETLLNAVVCSLIVIRLFFFNRDGSDFVLWGAILAWLLMIVCGSVTIRIVMGAYEGTTDPSELFLNSIVCVLIWRSKGNVVQLFKIKRGHDA